LSVLKQILSFFPGAVKVKKTNSQEEYNFRRDWILRGDLAPAATEFPQADGQDASLLLHTGRSPLFKKLTAEAKTIRIEYR
jgi:hypothetical protein